jgi:hypothetical protein
LSKLLRAHRVMPRVITMNGLENGPMVVSWPRESGIAGQKNG